MYPDEKHPSYGVFVKNFCNILDALGIDHNDYVMLKRDSFVGKVAGYFKFYLGTVASLLFKEYDMIYVHYASHSSIPVLIAHKFRRKTVYTNVHGSDVVPENAKQVKMQWLTSSILAISDKIIAPSEYFKRLVSKKYGIPEEIIFVSPSGGVNEKVFFKEKNKTCGEVLKLGYVGRVSYKKGWDTLLKACAQLTIPYSLTVVGNGLEYKQMRLLADSLEINEHITWYDLLPQEKLRGIYNAIDALVFPTEREGESLGLVALEAMACGTPVIASDYAAPAYYVNNGVNGFKYNCGDWYSLAETIIRFRNASSEEKQRMSDSAIETSKPFNQDAIRTGMKYILEN